MKRTCQVNECEAPTIARGYCQLHYDALDEHLDGIDYSIEEARSNANRRLESLERRLDEECREREYRDDDLRGEIESVKSDVSRMDRGW